MLDFGFRSELWPRASARATQARTSFLPARPHPGWLLRVAEGFANVSLQTPAQKTPVFSLHPQNAEGPQSHTHRLRELCFGPKAGRKKKVSQPPGEAGMAGPALPGAQAECAAGDVPAGPACPEPGSAAGGVPKVPANVTHRSVLSVPAERAWSAPRTSGQPPQSLQRGSAKCDSHPPGRETKSGPAVAQTRGGRGGRL